MFSIDLKVDITSFLAPKKRKLWRKQPQEEIQTSVTLVKTVEVPYDVSHGMHFTCDNIYFRLIGRAIHGEDTVTWTGKSSKRFSNKFQHPLERECRAFEKDLLDKGWRHDTN